MATMTRFTLPETHAAFVEWSRLTGHDWDAPEWGEVLAALDSCDLLFADRTPQLGLFDDPPHVPIGDTHHVRKLRAAIIGSARLYRAGWGYDLATSAQIVAAVLTNFFVDTDGDPFEHLVTRIEVEVPSRLRALVSSPSDALAELLRLRTDGVALPDLVRQVLTLACDTDAFAEILFEKLADDPQYRLGLIILCDGRWLLYDYS